MTVIERLADKWLQPAGVALVIAGTVWLIQLNVGFVTNRAMIEQLKSAQTADDNLMHQLIITQAKTAEIIVGVERRIDGLEVYSAKDEDQVRLLERQVIKTQNAIETHVEGYHRNDK